MENNKLNTNQIIEYLQITPPFLMIDYVANIIPGKKCHAIKKIKEDEWFFKSHLEKEQVMPGVLLIESMLQSLVLTIYTMDNHKGKIAFVSQVTTKLLSKVKPNNKLNIYAELLNYKRGISKGRALCKVNEKNVCTGEFTLISPHEIPKPKNIIGK